MIVIETEKGYTSTGSIILDACVGGSGVPDGSKIEMFGAPGMYRTAFGAALMANTPGRILLIDTDRSYNPAWAENVGIDLTKLDVFRPKNAEDIEKCDITHYDLIVIDSWNSVPGYQEDESDPVVVLAKRAACTFLAISQERYSPAVGADYSPGYKHSKLFDLRIKTAKLRKIGHNSFNVTVQIWKNKGHRPYLVCKVPFNESGIVDTGLELWEWLTETGELKDGVFRGYNLGRSKREQCDKLLELMTEDG